MNWYGTEKLMKNKCIKNTLVPPSPVSEFLNFVTYLIILDA